MASGNGRYAVEITEGIAKLPRDAWNALLDDDDSPFIEWDWLCAMEESKSATRKSGWSPCHLILRDSASARIVAACPMYLKAHSMGEFVFDHGWADAAERAGIRYYPKLLVAVPFTPHTGRRFLTAAGADRASLVAILARALISLCEENKLSSVHVNFCESDEAEALRTVGFMERLGCQYHWRNDDYATFDDYLGNLKSKRRSAVRHERRALEAQGVTIRTLVGDEIPDRLIGRVFDIYMTTIEKLYWGRQYLTREFFELMRQNFKQYINLVTAWRGEELIAGTFNLEKAGVMYGRYWGCFRELKYLHFNVCYYAAIEHCIARELKRFEPGAGGDYKWLRGFDPAPTRSMHFIADARLRKAVANALSRERREVEQWIAIGRDRSQLKGRGEEVE
jgi:uncharacterized protein